MSIQERIQKILAARKAKNEYRELSLYEGLIDFSSNDYLGLSKSKIIADKVLKSTQKSNQKYGSTGSRLLSGNSKEIVEVETQIAAFHNAEKALLFSSGFDANLGLISTLCRSGDVVIFDSLVHASIHQGIKLSDAKSYAFEHNNLVELAALLETNQTHNCFVIVESIYSMDGDKAPLKAIAELKEKYQFELIVDEAHALGVFGKQGRGLCQQEGIEQDCLARIYTFGKGLGAHGAAIVGPSFLIEYLVNFCKPFIYSTAPSFGFVKRVEHSYKQLLNNDNQADRLFKLIEYFNIVSKCSKNIDLIGEGPIFGLKLNDPSSVKRVAKGLVEQGFDVRPIVYPTVARGSERIRICLHSYNSEIEIDDLFSALNKMM